jgi:hypothetical protein
MKASALQPTPCQMRRSFGPASRKEGGGTYTVVTTNAQGEVVTVIRGKTAAELKGLSWEHGWNPPWD